jgi:prepilin-type N-terminal cleavage/methylation domain-containing protein
MKKTQKGFTLVELIITIVIVGILSLISGPIYEYYVEKARFTEAFSVLRAIADANTMYFVERGLWCNDIRELPIQIEGTLVNEDGAWRIQNDNFIYACVGDTSDDTIATVNRAPYHQRYWVSLRTTTGRYGDTPQLGDYGLYGEVYNGSKHKSLDERMVEYYKNRFPTDRLR